MDMEHDAPSTVDAAITADGIEEDIGSMVLHRCSESRRAADRHLCAVVGTMCQELKDHGVPLSPIAYFGAAASTLDRLTQDSSSGPDPTTKALLTFLSVVLPAVPAGAVRGKGGGVSGTLVRILGFGTTSEGATKAALKCLALVIADGDTSDWSGGIKPSFEILLGFATDKREKVRREAHTCLCDVLRKFQGTPVLPPASEAIHSHFGNKLLFSNNTKDSDANLSQVKGALEVLFMLNALKGCLPLMTNRPRNKVLEWCKCLLKIEHTTLTKAIMEILHALSSSSVPDISSEKLLDLLCSVASSVIGKERSADALAAAARLLHVGIKKAYDLNRAISVGKLPLIFNTLADILACEHEEAIFAATEAFKGLISSCIDDTLIKEGADQVVYNVEGDPKRLEPAIIEKISITMEGLLGYRYGAVWDMSFQIISSFFDRLGESASHLMVGVIKNLANLENLSDEDLVYRKQLHECIGSAVGAMGPETFLKILPLNLEYDELSKASTWLLPILKRYTVGARLTYFTESVVRIIEFMQQRSQKFESEGSVVSTRTAQGIVFSLWSLLPAFCNYPSDTSTSFKNLQNILCDRLSKEPELRGLICSSLQILIQQNKKVLYGKEELLDEQTSFLLRAKNRYTPQLAEENLNQLRSATPTFLSVLSKIFLNSSKDAGGCLLITIKEFASLSERKSIKNFFKNTMFRLLEVTKQAIGRWPRNSNSMQIDGSSNEDTLSVKRSQLLELAVSVLPGLDCEEIDILFNYIKSTIQSEEAIIQKKAYKTLSIILKERDDFLSNKLGDLLELMVGVMPACHFSAKRHRLESLYFLIVHIAKDTSEQRKPELISSFLTEIILALKEGNKKTRNRAYDLLVEIAHAFGDEEQGGKMENLQQFFNMVAGGLAGETPHMISAAVKGLARLAYEFSELVGAAYNLLPSSLLLLQRKNREICKANLGLVKVLVAKSQVDWLNVHLKGIVEGLLSWQDAKNQFKAKVKLLLEMLVKKCGFDAVKTVMPDGHMKLLTNIRKTAERKERKAKSEKGSMCSSSMFGESRLSRTNGSRLSRWNHTHIFSDVSDGREGNSDSEPVDLNEIAASQADTSSGFRLNVNSVRLKQKRKLSKSLPWDSLEELEHDPLDLLDMQKTRSTLRTSHLKRKPEDDSELEITPDGRIVITEDKKNVRKEKILSSSNDSDTRSQASSRKTAPSGASVHGKRRKTADSGWAYTGSEYTSKKAKGDVKRKDKLEPYAYWPLDRKLLNRREESKAIARKGMASVIKMTKKLEGKSSAAALSLKGMKLKRTHRKKHK